MLRPDTDKAFLKLLVANLAIFGLCPVLLQTSLSSPAVSLLSDAEHGVRPAHDCPRAMWVVPCLRGLDSFETCLDTQQTSLS